jgi:hypothetical protein
MMVYVNSMKSLANPHVYLSLYIMNKNEAAEDMSVFTSHAYLGQKLHPFSYSYVSLFYAFFIPVSIVILKKRDNL